MPPSSYRFGRFELQPQERRLLESGRLTALGPRAFDLLVALAERAGQLVGKDDLMTIVWPGLVVEENNLQVQISALRKVLGADVIETVAAHGYRFVPEIERMDSPSATSSARRHNLPRELTSFIGREAMQREQASRFEGTRLLTITGGGGYGKSRLALNLASGMLDEYADGGWLIELAAITDPAHVTAAFAAALGVTAARGDSLRDSIVRFVENRRLLLIVDNCEHVLRAVADLVKHLLRWAPWVKFIATSREPLHLTGEALCALSPLEHPHPNELLALDQAMSNPAIRLFVERARSAQSGFEVTSANLAAVAAICHRLDGIPLALELAAARVRTMTVEMLARKLEDRFRLLTSGDRSALARQQTLRNTIDWSYDLMLPPERELMRRLSVFAGGFVLEAAESVGASDAIAADDVLDLLSNLVDKSIAIADIDTGRYHMLETVRQYARDRLEESGETIHVRDAHLEWCLCLAEAAESKLIGPDQGSWFDRLELDRENMLAAHAWCEHAEEGAQRGLRLMCALRMYWQIRGPVHLGYQLTVEALAREGTETRNYARCQALFTAGVCAYYLGLEAEAEPYVGECLSIARERGDNEKTSDALVALGAIALARADFTDARVRLGEALSLARAGGDPVRMTQGLNYLGEVQAAEGDQVAADASYEESMRWARETGDHASVACVLLNLARTAAGQNAFERASVRLLESADMIDASGTHHYMQNWLAIASAFAAQRGDAPRAARLYGALAVRSKRDGFKLEGIDDAFVRPRIEQARQSLGASTFALAEAEGGAASDAQLLAEVRQWLRDGRPS